MTPNNTLRSIANRVRSQAEIAARPGQYDDLYDIAEELDRLADTLPPIDGSRTV